MKNELQKYNFLSIESKIVSIYLIVLKNYLINYLLNFLETFIIIDCGGSTIDITTHKLVEINPLQLSEITTRIRDFYGSTFIDKEFIKFLREKFESRAIDLLIENSYSEFRHTVYDFCQRVKMYFAEGNTEFNYTLDVEEKIPNLLQHVSRETKEIMEEKNWVIVIKYSDIKKMFDHVIDRIIRLIHIQLSNNKETCSAMLLVGGFSGNKYLQSRIKQEFQHTINIISTVDNPIAVISHGAVDYGLLFINSNLNKLENNDVSSTVLKYTYGIQFSSDWKNDDPPNRKTSDGKISKFITLVKRGTEVTSDQAFTFNFKPESGQTHAKFEIYYTSEESATYTDEPGMKLLGILNADLPGEYRYSVFLM
jgi:hypothetical protein